MKTQTNRDKTIIRTSIIGILANFFLAGFKAVIGFSSNSIAILLDAVNNLSDAASSVVTIVGTKLAGKDADRKHPFGYGRVEYLSASLISVFVLYASITALTESVKKILHPDIPDYSAVSLIIVGVAVLVKILLGAYVKRVGKEANSDSLVNSGTDALLDSVISASTLAAAAIYLIFHLSLEAYLGAIISLVIIRSGFEMLKDTISKILGERVDALFAKEIKETIASEAKVGGVYDLILHNYGPESFHGSVHIEVPGDMSADEIDKLIRKIQIHVYRKHGVILTAIGVYSSNQTDPEILAAKETVNRIVSKEPNVLQMHGFYLDTEEKTLRFDIVVGFGSKDRSGVYRKVCDEVQKAFPDYTLQIAMDTDFSEEEATSNT